MNVSQSLNDTLNFFFFCPQLKDIQFTVTAEECVVFGEEKFKLFFHNWIKKLFLAGKQGPQNTVCSWKGGRVRHI